MLVCWKLRKLLGSNLAFYTKISRFFCFFDTDLFATGVRRIPVQAAATRCFLRGQRPPRPSPRLQLTDAGEDGWQQAELRRLPLERAAARVCREAGATVACHVLVRDLNIHPERFDDRRIEVIANGLPLWSGAQLAVDTTLVSPLDASGAARRHQRQYQGAALRLARRAKERIYAELMRSQR